MSRYAVHKLKVCLMASILTSGSASSFCKATLQTDCRLWSACMQLGPSIKGFHRDAGGRAICSGRGAVDVSEVSMRKPASSYPLKFTSRFIKILYAPCQTPLTLVRSNSLICKVFTMTWNQCNRIWSSCCLGCCSELPAAVTGGCNPFKACWQCAGQSTA